MKKKFKETVIGKFLAEKGSPILDMVDDFFPPAKLLTALIDGDSSLSPEQKSEALNLMQQHEKEMYEIEVRDRESARTRQVDLAKAGQTDWMMIAVGSVGLISYLFMLVSVVFIPSTQDNPLFIHIMGMIEGVVLGNMFGYYYGTSKSSSDKNDMIKRAIGVVLIAAIYYQSMTVFTIISHT